MGTHCEVVISPCASNPCLYGGTCVTRGEGFYCQCRGQYSGQRYAAKSLLFFWLRMHCFYLSRCFLGIETDQADQDSKRWNGVKGEHELLCVLGRNKHRIAFNCTSITPRCFHHVEALWCVFQRPVQSLKS